MANQPSPPDLRIDDCLETGDGVATSRELKALAQAIDPDLIPDRHGDLLRGP